MSKIGVIGKGFVGSAVANYYPDAIIYDKYKKIGSMDEVNKADIIFICVPTPPSKDGYDLSAVKESAERIADGKIIVIKSTITPGTTEELQKQYPNKKFIFCPEFLTEKNANGDFANPDRIIMGYTNKSKEILYQLAPYFPLDYTKWLIMPAIEAELVKLFSNFFLVNKVVLFNLFFDICEEVGLNYEEVREGVAADTRIGRSHTKIWHGGGRGAGGSCFPKDMHALINWLKKKDFKKDMYFRLVQSLNNKYLKESGKE